MMMTASVSGGEVAGVGGNVAMSLAKDRLRACWNAARGLDGSASQRLRVARRVGYRARRQRPDRQPMGTPQLTERHHAQWIDRPPVRRRGRSRSPRRHPHHPAAEQLHDVERRLISPLQILQDDDRRAAKRAPQRHQYLAGRGATLGHLRQLSAHLGGDVEQRAQRPRREQRLTPPTSTATDRCRSPKARTSAVLPTPASPPIRTIWPRARARNLCQPAVERRKVLLALDQLHDPTLRRHPPAYQPATARSR